MVDIEEFVDDLIPKQVGLHTQKGQLLRSKILSSAFHQLSVEFDDVSEENKEQRELQSKLCGDMSVFSKFHDKVMKKT